MDKMSDKVVFVTGAARGQGRSHAVLLAEEGADVIGVDLCAQIDTVNYPMATPEDLEETVRLVEKTGRRMLGLRADVRDQDQLASAFAAGVAEFGHVDVVLANAGVMTHTLPPHEKSRQAFRDAVDVMLVGVWNTLQVSVPALIAQGTGGAIVITSSAAGLWAPTTDMAGGYDGYVSSKFAVVGLMKSYANALAKYSIRVNSVHPTGVATPMVVNDFFPQYIAANAEMAAKLGNPLPVEVIEAIDVSRAVLYLTSDDGRYVTGVTLPVDAGITAT